MGGWAVRVPASSANVGAGFDVLGMALTLHAEVGCGPAPAGAVAADEHHPAAVAFRRLGGDGPIWVRSPIPMGRGLGYSGAVRVGGAAAAAVQRGDSLDDELVRSEILAVTTDLEHHADNVAASLVGGVVVAAADRIMRVPLAFDPAVVVWVPDATSTSTDHSRTRLADTVSRADAVFNLGRVAMFVAACATGDVAALRAATEDRLHQAARLDDVPRSADTLRAGLEAGAWAAWLSGSGPTVAMWCESHRVDELVAALPHDGHAKSLRIDHEGATVIDAER